MSDDLMKVITNAKAAPKAEFARLDIDDDMYNAVASGRPRRRRY